MLKTYVIEKVDDFYRFYRTTPGGSDGFTEILFHGAECAAAVLQVSVDIMWHQNFSCHTFFCHDILSTSWLKFVFVKNLKTAFTIWKKFHSSNCFWMYMNSRLYWTFLITWISLYPMSVWVSVIFLCSRSCISQIQPYI